MGLSERVGLVHSSIVSGKLNIQPESGPEEDYLAKDSLAQLAHQVRLMKTAIDSETFIRSSPSNMSWGVRFSETGYGWI